MSTPISQGSKLTGLELYAPRRAEMQSEPAGVTSPQAPAPASASEAMPVQDERNDGDLSDDGSVEAVHARLEEAIRNAIDIGRSSDREELPADEPRLPPAPRLRTDDGTVAVDFGLSRAEVPRRNYADAEVEWRRSLLNPVVVPEPPDTHQRSVPTWLLRYALMIGGAAAVAYVIAVMPSTRGLRDVLPHDGGNSVATIALETKAEPEPSSRLVAEDQRAIANEPMPLEVSVDNAVQNASLRLAGLAAGTHLSAGSQVSDSSWQVPLDNLKNLYLYAPTDFVGVMNSALDLLGPDKRLIDRREVRFEWLVKKESRPEPSSSIWSANPAPVQSLNGDLASTLMRRGQDFLGAGDIAAARVLFGRLADAGVADGAFAMAQTYDPRYLTVHKVIGVAGDESKARAFYQQAAQLGSVEAAHMLEQTVSK